MRPLRSLRARAIPAALEYLINFVASCGLNRLVGIDHCWIEATQ